MGNKDCSAIHGALQIGRMPGKSSAVQAQPATVNKSAACSSYKRLAAAGTAAQVTCLNICKATTNDCGTARKTGRQQAVELKCIVVSALG